VSKFLGLTLSITAGKTTFGSVTPAPAPATFDPATLSLTGWWRASFSGVPWVPHASAGTSGTNGNWITATGNVAPSVGTAVNGLTPASFDGATQALHEDTVDASGLFTVTTGTLIALISLGSNAAPAANYYQDAAIMTDASGNWGLVANASGFRAGVFDTPTKQTNNVAASPGYHLVVMRWSGGTLKLKVDSASDVTVSFTGNLSFNNVVGLFAGKNYAGTAFLSGSVLEFMTAQTALDDATLDSIRTSYVNSRYNLNTDIDAAIASANPVLWLRGDTETGSPLTLWSDKSGNGNDAAPGTNPTITATDAAFNNKQTIVFGGSDYLVTPSVNLHTAYTIFLAQSQTSIVSFGGLFKTADTVASIAADGLVAYVNSGGTLVVSTADATTWFWQSAVGAIPVDGTAYLCTIRSTGAGFSGFSVRVNGVDITSAGSTSGTFAQPSGAFPIFPGAAYFVNKQRGHRAEDIVFATALTTTQITNIESRLRSLYGTP